MSNDANEATLDRRADVFRKTQAEFVENTHIQELRMIFEIITAISVHFEGGRAANEFHKPVWKRLIKSGNVRRTKRRVSAEIYALTKQFTQYRNILNGPDFRKVIQHQGVEKELWQFVAEALSELLKTVVFVSDPERAQSQNWIPKAFEGLSSSQINDELDRLAQAQPLSLKSLSGELSEDDQSRFEAVIIEFCELGIEICDKCLRNPLGISYRPETHFFSGTLHLKTEEVLSSISFSKAEHVDFYPVYMQDKKDDIYFYFLMGPEATLALVFLAMPNFVLKGLSRVFPMVKQVYENAFGHTLEDRFSQKEEPREALIAQLGKVKRPTRRRRQR